MKRNAKDEEQGKGKWSKEDKIRKREKAFESNKGMLLKCLLLPRH